MKILTLLLLLITGNSYAIIGFERCIDENDHLSCNKTPLGWFSSDSEIIYKILRGDEFSEYYADGVFIGSIHDQRDGFIHLSTGEQLGPVLDKYFKGESVYIVALYPDTFGDNLVWENNYPHLYNVPLKFGDSIGAYLLD